MPDFSNKIDIIPSEAFDSLFGDDSNAISVGKNDKPTETSPKANATLSIDTNPLPIINLDELDKEVVVEGSQPKPEEEEKKDDKPTDKPEEGEEVVSEEVKTALKNTVNFMIEKGYWKDFEGREDMEFDNDTYADLVAEQNRRQIDSTVNEILDGTGDYGKAIINHIRQGGNPDEIIDLFKEHKRVELLGNTDSIEGKKQFVTEYYRKFNNWSESKAERYVNGLIENEQLDSEVDEVKDNYKQIQEEELAEIRQQQETHEKEQEKKREETKQNLTKAIDDNEELTKDEKKVLKTSLFKFNRKLDNGSVVNDFLYKFTAFQNDPKKYAELVHFIVDNEGYKKKLQQKGEVQVKKEKWNFIKDNAAINKKITPSVEKPDARKPSSAYQGTNFKFI